MAIVRYTFDGQWGARNKSVVDRFLEAARQAKEILVTSDAEWQRLAPRIGVRDAAALAIFRQRCGEGIFRRPIAEEEADARSMRSSPRSAAASSWLRRASSTVACSTDRRSERGAAAPHGTDQGQHKSRGSSRQRSSRQGLSPG